jgi:hypothetical protein
MPALWSKNCDFKTTEGPRHLVLSFARYGVLFVAGESLILFLLGSHVASVRTASVRRSSLKQLIQPIAAASSSGRCKRMQAPTSDAVWESILATRSHERRLGKASNARVSACPFVSGHVLSRCFVAVFHAKTR